MDRNLALVGLFILGLVAMLIIQRSNAQASLAPPANPQATFVMVRDPVTGNLTATLAEPNTNGVFP